MELYSWLLNTSDKKCYRDNLKGDVASGPLNIFAELVLTQHASICFETK